ncbi:hypothetical protein BB559_001006 [Furculomyces boomerangus]|uniref:Timeless N-terminal domain-containing protein n=1 Tax=Furculomyces boomerangus TaxID=61424 RepID=A0A2T9YE79_9FUNG|nr:hypothetical protein BB559_004493 [Furculomyces boomerangus]PVU99103.1 hypothetical protein BB559_001006 [Furculomyces boomerangus]
MDYSDDEFDLEQELLKYRNVVLSACTSLGGLEKRKVSNFEKSVYTDEKLEKGSQNGFEYVYIKGDECLECLKDIKRYIRLDELSGEKLVLKWLSEWSVFSRDLVPIFKSSANSWLEFEGIDDRPWFSCDEGRGDEYKAMTLCMDLFVFMTWSMDNEEADTRESFERSLREYKKAFCENSAMSLLIQVAARIFEVPVGRRTDKDKMLLQGSLYVIRNLLGIRDPFVSSEAYGLKLANTSLQDWMIQVMDEECGIDLFIVAGSSMDDKNMKVYTPIVLDVFYSLYQRVSVSSLMGKGKDISSVEEITNSFSKSKGFGMRPGRHNRFGSTYAGIFEQGKLVPIFNPIEAMKIFAKPLKRSRKPLQRKVNAEIEKSIKTKIDDEEREISPEASEILKKTALSFIKNCFGSLFPVLLEDLELQRDSLDETGRLRLLYMTGYFIDFFISMYQIQRRQAESSNLRYIMDNPEKDDNKLDFPYISAVTNQGGIGMCLRQLSDGLESQNLPQTQAAMYCFRSILKAIREMSLSSNPDYIDSSTYIQSNLFYDGSVLDLMIKISGSFKPTKHTLGYVIEMIRTVDEFIESLNEYSTQKQSMYVKKKAHRKKKKNAEKKSNKRNENETDKTDLQKEPGENQNDENNIEKQKEATNELEEGKSDTLQESVDNNESDSDSDQQSSDDDRAYRDIRFDFSNWLKAFAIQPVANTYASLVKACLILKGGELKALSKMIYRIAVIANKPHVFFKKKIFTDFYNFLTNYSSIRKNKSTDSVWLSALADLQDDLAWIFREYFKIYKYINFNNTQPKETPAPQKQMDINDISDNEFSDLLDSIASGEGTSNIQNTLENQSDNESQQTQKSVEIKEKNVRGVRKGELMLFEDKASYIRLKSYLDESSLGTNINRYPLQQEQLHYDDYPNDSDYSDDNYNPTSKDSNLNIQDDTDIQTQLSLLKGIDKSLLTWKQKATISIKILKELGKQNLLDLIQKEMDNCIKTRIKDKSKDKLSYSQEDDSDLSDNELELAMKTSDYVFEVSSDSTIDKDTLQDENFLELLSLLHITKNSNSEGDSYTIIGLESTEDISENLELLRILCANDTIDEEILDKMNTSIPSKDRAKSTDKSSSNGKPKPRTNGKKRMRESSSLHKRFSAKKFASENSAELENTLDKTIPGATDTSSSDDKEYTKVPEGTKLTKKTNRAEPQSSNSSGTDSELEANPVRVSSSAIKQRSAITNDFLESSEDEDGTNSILKGVPKSGVSGGSKTTDSKLSQKDFRERALDLRRRLIKEKSKRVLLRRDKYSDEDVEN